jgi:hypothetical protein
MPEQYGITNVPSTVPSTPLRVIASNRQIIRKDAAAKRARKHHGANAPVRSRYVLSAFSFHLSRFPFPPVSQSYNADAEKHRVTATLTHQFSKALRGSLNYGYFSNRDVTYGGHKDYTAHLIYTSVQYWF